MTEQDNTAPAVWDPTARGGAGGWVRPAPAPQPTAPQPARDDQHTEIFPLAPPQAPQAYPPQAQQGYPQPPQPGAVGDHGPPLGARPYLPPPGPVTPPRPPFGGPPAPPSGYGFPPPAPVGGFPGAQPPQPHQPPLPHQQPGAFPGPQPTGTFPGYQQPAPQRPYPEYEEVPQHEPRRRVPLLVAIGVVLVVVVGVGVAWAVRNGDEPSNQATTAATAPPAAPQPAPAQSTPAAPPSGGNSPSPSAGSSNGPQAEAQAKALDALLARGEDAKAPIGNAVAKVNSCPGKAEITSAVEIFETGATQRDQLVADLAKLDFGDLPAGVEAVALLKTAWQTSGDVDRAYAAWARTVGSQGCTNGSAPTGADLKRANELNPQASQAKKDFVAKWNSLANTFGLTARTWDRI
ncbi:hypothetical protein [Kitasatospora sp. Root107]|uniref:hypothetical protein n=1 Tax=Kitasatospora sp. Root107 TaxID=1736424 RepID=UPI0007095086|nr:hypothetical protein [Kitasatospora sp. Root107]KQV05697.1 hypothetical protein ASC99_12990 [Kitasatospora sp. Root107]